MESSRSELVSEQLARLLAHPEFSKKKRLSEFLRFVVTNSLQGDLSRLKETVIGVEVYQRDPSYNPKENPIVRTEARRLRALPEAYYAGCGQRDPVIIEVPKGSYVAHFSFTEPQAKRVEQDACAPVPNVPLPLDQRHEKRFMGFCWKADDRSLIAASRRGDGVAKLWEMSIESRQTKQLTDGSALLAFPSMTRRGDRIAFTSYRTITTIWRQSGTGKRPLISDESGNSNPELSPDGTRLVFRSDRTGAFEIWISDSDGRNERRLTHFNGPMVNSTTWSPDGKVIAFECRPRGHSDICLIPADGKGAAQRFTTWESNEILPSWSRDGRYLYFSSNHSGRWEVYKQAVAGGNPIAITEHGGMRAVESWDGRLSTSIVDLRSAESCAFRLKQRKAKCQETKRQCSWRN